MPHARWVFGAAVGLLVTASLLLAQAPYRRDDVFQFVNGYVLGETGRTLSGMTTPNTGVVQIGGTDVTTLNTLAGTMTRILDANGTRQTPPATQTIAAGNTVAADACGGVKNITAAGAVTTSTVDTFTTPAATNANCVMLVCNVGAQTITLDKNANLLLVGGADVALLANSCVMVGSNGTVWRQLTAQLTAT